MPNINTFNYLRATYSFFLLKIVTSVTVVNNQFKKIIQFCESHKIGVMGIGATYPRGIKCFMVTLYFN